MVSPILSSLILLAATLRACNAATVTASVPISAPADAAGMDPALLSLSLEQDRWPDWAGTTSRNNFFFNTLDNLKQRTGQPPWIRIGADSEDHTNYNPAVQYAQTVFPASSRTVPYPEASKIVVGDQYYQLVSHLPPGTNVIWGVNFGQNNITSAYLQAKAISKAFQTAAVKDAGVTLAYIEIGNEADYYANNGDRQSSTWTVAEYVKEWTTFAANVSVAAGITSSSTTKFIAGSFLSSSHRTGSFSPQGMFAAGILNSAQGKLIKSISQHHYSGSYCSGSGGLIQSLMTKSSVRSNLDAFNSDVYATRSHGLTYVLGETNSYTCHGAPGVSNTAGAAIWTLDYTLYASQAGMRRLHFHSGVGYKYNLMQPVTLTKDPNDGSTLSTPLAPHVQPQYYAALIIGEAIGTTGSAKGVELSLNDQYLSGYAYYEGGVPKRAVLINSEAYLSTTTSARTSKTVALNFSGSGTAPKTMTVKRLKIRFADDQKGLTWGGQSFETSDARPSGSVSVETVNVGAGVTISETEAVLLTFN